MAEKEKRSMTAVSSVMKNAREVAVKLRTSSLMRWSTLSRDVSS